MITEVFGITYEALGDADVDELGLALGLDETDVDGLADVELDTELLGLAERLEDGDRDALGLALVSGSSALARMNSVTSSS